MYSLLPAHTATTNDLPPETDMSLISQGPLLLSLLQQTVFFKNDPVSAVVQILFP